MGIVTVIEINIEIWKQHHGDSIIGHSVMEHGVSWSMGMEHDNGGGPIYIVNPVSSLGGPGGQVVQCPSRWSSC